jgi:hypothetical protein
MTHEEAFLLMMGTLDQVAGRADQDRLHQHLSRCAECAAEWEALQAVEGLFLHAPVVAAPETLSTRVMQQLEGPSWTRTLGALFALGLGSVLALLVVAIPALIVLLVCATAYTEPAQFAGWVAWFKGLAAVGGTLATGLGTALRLFVSEAAGSPVALAWLLAAVLAVGLWAHLMRHLEPSRVMMGVEE